MTEYQIGLYGLGVMGSSLAKNLIHHGVNTALYSKPEKERKSFSCPENKNWQVFEEMTAFVESLSTPRVILLMITAGSPVDMVIEELSPHLVPGDILIDGGNSRYTDTLRRLQALQEKGICYLGTGISGGEKGALEGPSMMAGGSREAWEHCGSILQLIAAHAGSDSCCGYVGGGGAGHYVKMVHNGIEYAILQLIADVYHLMRTGLKLSNQEIAGTFKDWSKGALDSYLIDITLLVLEKEDPLTGGQLVDYILDVAQQKGTGSWTLIEGMERGVYIPTISEAVFARYLSKNTHLRQMGNALFTPPEHNFVLQNGQNSLEEALLAGIICSYAQGIELIRKASKDFGWGIDLPNVISLWRGGCIIRSSLLEKITYALRQQPDIDNLILTEEFAPQLNQLQKTWREVVAQGMMAGLAEPALASTITYYDSIHTDKMPLNLVQALRDCFGAHTYQRIDREGDFHTQWESEA